MKKLSIYITVLLAAALTACNEDFNEGVASPQSYGQEEAAGKITFTATGVAPINIGNVEEELEKSYEHLCKLRDEVIEMGIIPAIKDWHALNPNID